MGSLELLIDLARPIVTKATDHVNTDNDGLWATTPQVPACPVVRPSITHWDSEWPARRETEAPKLVLSSAVSVENGKRDGAGSSLASASPASA